jgi:hypothetical protein
MLEGMSMRKKIIIACILAMLAVVAVAGSLDRIVIFVLSRFYSTDVSYRSMNKDSQEGFVFEGLKVMNKKIGFGLFAARASFKPVKRLDFWRSLDLDIKLKDVHFIKQKGEAQKPFYGKPEELVAMPFEGRWTYRDVTGGIEIFSNGITLKKFSANGNQIRLFVSGDIFYNSAIDANITILFSKEVLKDIPPELHSVVMNEEPRDWKSFSVKLKGDMRSPAMQVSGKLFRLNIGTVIVKD